VVRGLLVRGGMKIAASVVGIVGGFCGMAFAQMIVSISALLSVIASQSVEAELGPEFYLGLLAIVFCAVGAAGAGLALARPAVASMLMLIASIADLVLVFAISGAPQTADRPVVLALFPFIAPVMLFAGAGLAAATMRVSRAMPVGTAAPVAVAASHAELASAVPMPLLAEPVATAPTRRELEPGTAFDSYEQQGEFVRVRGADFEGYLPAWSVRRVA
jgi:hypothetical protein